jgi:hypothetical protein
MMDVLTFEDVRAAQNGDGTALKAVFKALEGRTNKIATDGAKRMGYGFADFREEFALRATETLWEYLGNFDGDTLDHFYAFAWRTMHGAVTDAVREYKCPGGDKGTLQEFARWVGLCEGDAYAAEARCQGEAPAGFERFGADRARAARMAWVGDLSLDAPAPGGDSDSGMTYAELIADRADVSVDLIEPGDITAYEREQARTRVHAVLDDMGENQAEVLRCTFGIQGRPVFATARGENQDAELAQRIGVRDAQAVQKTRTTGYLAFAKRWAKDEEDSDAWMDAYQAERDRNKRSLRIAA